MKRLILICILCVLILPVVTAQSVSIGAKIGGDNEIRGGFTIGVFSNFEIVKAFVIQIEILYSLLGGAYNYYEPFFSSDLDCKATANVLELPVLLMPQFRMGKGEIRIFAGPELGLILGNIEYEEKMPGTTISIYVEPDNKVVFGFKGGIGYAHPLGKGTLVFDSSYTRSLTEIFENDNTAVNVLMLSVGYQIGI